MSDLAPINAAIAAMQGPATREQIERLQGEMLAHYGKEFGDTDDVCPVTHHFAPGLYAREMFIPAGTAIVGKTHRFAHLNTVSRGRIVVKSEHGSREVCAPSTFLSQPGIKRVGYALEDTVWTTFHPTEKVDLVEIEADVIVPEKAALETYKKEAIK